MTLQLQGLLPYTLNGVHAVDEADIAADIAAGDGAIKYLLKDFIQRVADFLLGNTGFHGGSSLSSTALVV